MAVDAELISSESFNLKFKNYLRDFYVYQFKERGRDFKAKGIKERAEKEDAGENELLSKDLFNKDIVDRTFYSDAKRLQYALEQSAGVSWNKGDYADIKKNRIDVKRKNKRVECITVDSREIAGNPFFSVYQLCSEGTRVSSTYFSFVYILLVYFQLGKRVKRTASVPLTHGQEEELNEYLQVLAEIIRGEVNSRAPKAWRTFTDEEKREYASKAIERFARDHDEMEEIYDHMAANRQRIVFQDGRFSLANDESGYVEKSVLYSIMKQLDTDDEQVGEKQFGNKMQEMVRLGIVKCEKRGNRIFYALSDRFLCGLLGDNEDLCNRLADCVSFFAQTGALGEIGTYLLQRFPEDHVDHIRYKHNYLMRALNDYNNIDLLFAMKNKLWTVIEYRSALPDDLQYQRILCYPIELRESVTDGRQYLVYYHAGFRSVSAMRAEFIDSITLGWFPKNEYFDDDMARAREVISHTWGNAYLNFQEGNVKTAPELSSIHILIKCEEKEGFIRARLKRELRNIASPVEIHTEKYGLCMEITAKVVNPWEMLQWLRSYITRVVSVEINGKECEVFTDNVIRTYRAYIGPVPAAERSISSRTGKSLILDDIPADFIPVDNMHSLVFCELFSAPFRELGQLLISLLRDPQNVSEDRIKKMKEAYAGSFAAVESEKKRKDQAEGFIRTFLDFRGGRASSIFTLTEGQTVRRPADLLPITSIEAQWLGNILRHPLAKGFLEDAEIYGLLERLGEMDLFDINEIVLYDQFTDVEEFYRQSDFGAALRMLRKAIRENRKVKIAYQSQYGRKSNYICSPVYLEYSRRDNRFRIQAVSGENAMKTFNLERIQNVTEMEETFDRAAAERVIENHAKENECELVVFFNGTKNIPDRILTEFSCFRKKCVKWGSERYRMTLYYDRQDEREILVRLLGYGAMINVFNDTGDVRRELIERLENQLELQDCMDSVFADE